MTPLKCYSTGDNIIVLYSFLTIYIPKYTKNLFCNLLTWHCFRDGLWLKVQISNITASENIISLFSYVTGYKPLYQDESKISCIFDFKIGVKQGENLSPYLFPISEWSRNLFTKRLSSKSEIYRKFMFWNVLCINKIVMHYADDTNVRYNKRNIRKKQRVCLRSTVTNGSWKLMLKRQCCCLQ